MEQTYQFSLEPDLPLKEKMNLIERTFIAAALQTTQGRVTGAARVLGFRHHQSLINLINHSHRDLLNERTTIRPRRKSLMNTARPRAPRTIHFDPNHRTSILLVSDGQHVAPLVRWPTSWSATAVGKSALELITGDAPFDVLVLCDTAEMAADDLAARVQRISHRRKTPQLLLVRDAAQAERAWQAGADAVLLMPEERDQIVNIVARLLKGRR